MRGRECKTNLDYFPVEVGVFKDKKLIKLRLKYGPLGESVFLRILGKIYESEGYYLEISLDDLSLILIDEIGAKWCRDVEKMREVIGYCAELGLFDKTLMMQNVMTSHGIQKRYAGIVKQLRRNIQIDKYCLLDTSLSVTTNRPNDEENQIYAEEIQLNDEEITINKIKSNQIKVNEIKEEEREITNKGKSSANNLSPDELFKIANVKWVDE